MMANQEMILDQDVNLAIDRSFVLDLGHPQNLSLDYTHSPYDLALSLNQNFDLRQHHSDKPLAPSYHNHQHYSQEYSNELDPERYRNLIISEDQEPSHNNLLIEQNPDTQLVSLPFRQVVTSSKEQLAVGQEFPDVNSCRRAIRNVAIACHFEIQTMKSDQMRFTAKCAADGCPWRIHAAKLAGVPTFSIRTINDNHTCAGITHVGHQAASVEWVANTVEEKLRENPNYKPKDILEEIHRVHGITLSYKQAWRGKERVMSVVRGSFEQEYRLLPQYCEQIRKTNPGSVALVYGNSEDNCFHRLFISYYASIYGFVNACMPVIGLGCIQLKNKYLGALLVASGFDGDGALFPIAFGVVEEETDQNWIWFLTQLRELLESNTENMPMITFLSDRKDGLVEAVGYNFPSAFHVFCMYRLAESFVGKFDSTVLVNLLWEAAQAPMVIDFETKIAEIESHSPEAASWIKNIPGHLWASALFEGRRFGHLTANIRESLISWIHDASRLPIIQMMEYIRREMMTWFNERREMCKQWSSILVPSAEHKVSYAQELAKSYRVERANEAKFEVVSSQGTVNVVDIISRCCYCREWQLYGLPCVHGVAALGYCSQNIHKYAEQFFTVSSFQKAYSQTIHPIPDKSLWNERSELVINPPRSLRPPVKPRRKRVRADNNEGAKRVVHCSRCNQIGHFRTTCTAPT